MSTEVSGRRKTVLITGCTPGGIGHALALEFHSKGLHVIATARRTEVLNDLADQGLTTLQLDVTDSESIATCKKQVSDLTGGRLDILVNNAGRSYTMPALDIDVDEVRATYETNVIGVMAVTQAFTPLLIQARGLVVMISSLSSMTPYVFASVYGSTKAALNGYSRVLRQELRPFGVRVLVSLTGTVRSNFTNVDRTLPPQSLYARMADAFARRIRFSQNNATCDTRIFARKLVAEALRGEGWLSGLLWRFWGSGIGGTTKWFYAGGFATRIWFARTFVGEWLLDQVLYRKFGLNQLEALVRKDGVKRGD